MKRVVSTLFVFILFFSEAGANIRLPKIFTSGMVLQQGKANPIWGWADEGEAVEISFAGKTIRAKVDKEGRWRTALPVMAYGGPHTLRVKGKNVIELNDILIGEVWLCSGQSNMEMAVGNAKNAAEEISAANYPEIRLYAVPYAVNQYPQEDSEKGQWHTCSPATIARFSAVGYFFGRDLHQKLKVPVGLIVSSRGGTVAESWTSSEAIEQDPDFKSSLIKLRSYTPESYKAEKVVAIQKMIGAELPSKDDGVVNEKAGYAQAEFNDANWKTIQVPGFWETKGYPGIDGIAWYRKEFSLLKEESTSDLELHIGRVESTDIAWFNGSRLKTVGTNKDRIYTIPANLLREGKNIFALRVTNDKGAGGLAGAENLMFLKTKTSRKDITGDWKFKISEIFDDVFSMQNIGANDYPTLLFNGMINPIIPFGIKGVIWYQGENNATRAKQYNRVFPNLINNWRAKWALGDFPFLFVSLANFRQPVTKPSESPWAELREAQASALKLPNTGMAIAIDLGEANDIHPKNKQEVGRRLALNALKEAYNKSIVASGPVYKTMKIEGSGIKISFLGNPGVLQVKSGGTLVSGFSIAGEDKKFYFAKAELLKDNTILVSADQVEKPVAVRYAWADNPGELNLYNTEGLPACPFRTDNWPGVTK